jgi:hypothetical protein
LKKVYNLQTGVQILEFENCLLTKVEGWVGGVDDIKVVLWYAYTNQKLAGDIR